MRPINLKLKGINSYVSEQVVDFEKLSQLNLFGIFGETGSGKTTILDAIVMALYGTSERDVTQNIINVNCSDAYIIFEFEMIEGDKKVRYIVRRDYKLRPSGLKTDAILTKASNKQVLAEHSDEVNERILKIIRVGKKEFLKCIALPQGEFDRFLLDTPMNRKKTVAKLFNLESFGQDLNDKLKKRREITTLKKLSLEDKLVLYRNINPENLENLTYEIKQKNKDITDLEFILNKKNIEHTLLLTDFERKGQLADLQIKLDLRLQDKADIDYLSKQLSFTRIYGDYLLILNKYNGTIEEEKRVQSVLENLKENLLTFEKEYVEKSSTLSTLTWSKKQFEEMLFETKNNAEVRARLENEINAKLKEESELKESNSKLTDKITSLKLNLATLNKNIIENTKKYNSIAEDLNATNKDLEQLEISKSTDFKEEVISFLKSTRNLLTQEAVDEIKGTNACKVIKEIYERMFKFEKAYITEVAEARSELSRILQFENSIEECTIKLKNKQVTLTKELNATEDAINEDKQSSYKVQAELSSVISSQNSVLASLHRLGLVLATENKQLLGLPTKEAVEELENNLKDTINKIEIINNEMAVINNNRQQTIIDIEINSSLLENTKQKINELKELMDSYEINEVDKESLSDQRLLLDPDEMVQADKTINDFLMEISHLESSIKDIRNKIVNPNVTLELVEESEKEVNLTKQEIEQIKIDIALLQNQIEAIEKNKEIAKQIQDDLKTVQKDLDTILDLQELLAGGALLEYVAEEYMYLITEFANKYVYSISKGKYFLKYTGDFVVIDNFNGGIRRGVKTLSGGERFLISLSLALGISQSIATNNNQNFNFFFIDEGFGSLSENYIDKVLQSFDALIKLDFTVGFITHVEKMQNYITNRIVVSKESNERGSIIHSDY